jgi:hypothetical protein
MCLKGGYEYGFRGSTPEELQKYEAGRKELLDKLRAEAMREKEQEAYNTPLQRLLRQEYADLSGDNKTFSEKLTALMTSSLRPLTVELSKESKHSSSRK